MNKFEKPRDNKLGFINKMKEKLDDLNSSSFSVDFNTAIPVWDLLGMTEADYHIKYSLNVAPAATPIVQTEVIKDLSSSF